MSLELLAELAEHYLGEHGGALLRPEPLAEALAWATTPSHGASSLLLPTSTDGYYLAFDYLIDLPGLDSIPHATWDTLIEHATPQQAFAIGDTGDNAAAVRILEGIVADRERWRDPDTIGTLRARYHLAQNTAYSGHRLRAVELYTQLIADQQHLLGPEHRDTLETRHERADTLMGLGDYTAATAEFTELLADQPRVLGPDHPDTLMTRHCHANCVGESGDPRRAVAFLTDLVADRERILGPDNPRVFQTRSLAARFTEWAGDPARAAEMCRQLARDQERVLGATHRHTLSSRYHYVQYTAQAGNPYHTAALLDTLLNDWRAALGPETSNAYIVYVLLNEVGGYHGLPNDEQPVQREHTDVLATFMQLLGPEHEMTKETQRLLHNRMPTA